MLTSAITRNISLVKDRTYTLTARLKNTSSTATSCTIGIASLTTLPCSLAAGAVDNFSKTFTAPATGTFILTVPQTANVLLEWLQVEQGSAFTKHDNIGSAFQRTGIDIENGIIRLQADKVTFTNSAGTVSDKIWIDPTYGTLHAVNGDFSGKITATDGTIGGFSIGQHSIKSSNDKIILNDDGTATIGGLSITSSETSFTGKITAQSGSITGDISIGSTTGQHMLITPNDKTVTVQSISYTVSKGLQFYNGNTFKGGLQYVGGDLTLFAGNDANVKIDSGGVTVINPGSTYNYIKTNINSLTAWIEWTYSNSNFLRLGVARGKIYGYVSDKSDFKTLSEAKTNELYLENGFLKIK